MTNQPKVEPLSAEELKAEQGAHYINRDGMTCETCVELWPCESSRLLSTIEQKDRELAELRAALEGISDECAQHQQKRGRGTIISATLLIIQSLALEALNPPSSTPEPAPRKATADERTVETCRVVVGQKGRWGRGLSPVLCGKPLFNGVCPDHPAEGKVR